MFKNLKLGVRLGIGFCTVLSLLIFIAALAISDIAHLNDDIQQMTNDRFPKTVQANAIIRSIDVIARNLRNAALFSGEEQEKALAAIPPQRKNIIENLEKLDKSIHSDRGREILKRIHAARIAYIADQDRFIDLLKQGKLTEIPVFMQGSLRRTQSGYIAVVDELIRYQTELMDSAGENAARAAASYERILALTGLAATLLTLAFAWYITISITRPVQQAVDAANRLAEGDLSVKLDSSAKDEIGILMRALQHMIDKLTQIIGEVHTAADNLTSASGQVSAAAQSLSQSSSEQAASVEETTSSMEQISASIAQNTENARVTDAMAAKAAQDASEGGKAVARTVEDMKSIAGKIGIIDDIAYQTNLLALNAAIEAARAGDHGKGFAVVAAEVRKLAERSQIAAQEIGALATSSVNQAEQAGTLLTEMVPKIRNTSDLVQEIASASAEQSSSVGQINGAMGQLNQATQQNASASEELAATAEELGAQAAQLQQTMQFFQLAEGPRHSSADKVSPVAKKVSGGQRGVNAPVSAPDFSDSDFVRY